MTDIFAWVARALYVRSQVLALRALASNGQLVVGTGTHGIPEILVSHAEDRVAIGRFCSIAPSVLLIAGAIRPVDVISTFFRQDAVGI